LRWVGVLAILIGLVSSQSLQRPQILIEERASNVAIMDGQGHYVFADARKGKFAGEKWLQGNGEITTVSAAAILPGWTCAENMCFADVGATSIGYIHEQPDASWTCPPVDVVIADFPLRRACSDVATRIDRFDVWRHGAHAVYIADGVVRLETVKAAQGDRPWVYVSRARPTPYKKKPPPPELPITAFSG
jgi:competence protein ComEC